MGATYDNIGFKLYLPTYYELEDHLSVKFRFEYKMGNQEKIIYYKAVLTDKTKVTHFNETPYAYLVPGKRIYDSKICILQDGKKIFINGATLKLFFLSNSGKRTEVVFRILRSEKAQLLDVLQQPMTEEEKQIFRKTIIEKSSEETAKEQTSSKKKQQESTDSAEHGTSGMPKFDRYINALRTEKYYLKNKGGRKYKVTNGKLISSVKGIFSYIFDMETELHISDDAPVKVTSGIYSVSGTVLMCEDFQIIVQLENNIGDRIAKAEISVEPWKLLEALLEYLNYGNRIKQSRIASKLFNEGPEKATEKPANSIPKGQDAVIHKAMSEPICIVWGPPGTGKTHTMSELAIKYMNQNKTVLIVSHSNVSVDGVAQKIEDLLLEKGQKKVLEQGNILRYGYVRDEQLNKDPYVSSFYYTVTKNPSLKTELDSLQDKYDQIKHTKGLDCPEIVEIRRKISTIRNEIREQEQTYVRRASIVATTISKVVIDQLFENRKYDVVMFDEASMAYVLQVIFAATFAKEHFICVGDFMQLAPIAQSGEKQTMCEDIFAFLGINRYGKPYFHPWLVMLNEQRRMHPKIAAFSNEYVYDHLLKNHSSVTTSRNEIVNALLFKGKPINLIDLSGCYCAASKNADNSRYNIMSALISFAAAVKTEQHVETVSIITPYAAQTRLIRAMVLDYREKAATNLRCATVHQFQGSESDVVYFDAVESYPSKKPGWLMGRDFNAIMRLINVAVTRSKGKLVTVANSRFWENNYKGSTHTFYRLVSYLKEKGNVVSHMHNDTLKELILHLSSKAGPQFYFDFEKYMGPLKTDIERAKGRIIVSLPKGDLFEKHSRILSCLKKAQENGVQLLIKCNRYAELPESWKDYAMGTTNATFPLIMIDDKITWYGVPEAGWAFTDGNSTYHTVCPFVCRIRGEHTAEMIRSLSDLDYRETDAGKATLTEKNEMGMIGDNGASGLTAYLTKTKRCPSCKQPLKMTRGKSGKAILWCKDCRRTEVISPGDVEHYISKYHVRCPEHKCEITVKLSSYGIYLRCDRGHNLKPEQI